MNKTAITLLSLLLLTACATQPVDYDAYDPPGFFMGFWNGLIIFFSLIGHLFDSTIRIYAFPNSGGWYDFGFFLGVGALGGGAASSR
ncbi:MAG: hypothetical protein WCD70_10505 [Alphaproteobacteria bacterium]